MQVVQYRLLALAFTVRLASCVRESMTRGNRQQSIHTHALK